MHFKATVQYLHHPPSVVHCRLCHLKISHGITVVSCDDFSCMLCSLAAYIYQFVILFFFSFHSTTQNPHSLLRNRRNTSQQRWRRWWTFPARHEVKNIIIFVCDFTPNKAMERGKASVTHCL